MRDNTTYSVLDLRTQLVCIPRSSRKELSDTARKALLSLHYLRRLPPVSFAFELTLGGVCVGVLTLGSPPSRAVQKSACPTNPGVVIELSRLWLDDSLPTGIASWFVARCLATLPSRIVVSYADTAAGHHGGVYRACNFFYAGLTDADRKTPRYDYVPLNGKHSRDAFRSGEFTRVRRKPKHRYWIITGNRREKRQLLRLAGWAAQSWSAK